MRRAIPLVVLLLSGCVSSAPDPARSPMLIEMVELYGPSQVGSLRMGSSLVAEYGFRIANPTAGPVTLKRIDLQSVGMGGYYLRREDRPFDIPLPPDGAAEARLQARVYMNLNNDGTPSREPVILRAVLYFQGSEGTFQQIVQRRITQFAGD